MHDDLFRAMHVLTSLSQFTWPTALWLSCCHSQMFPCSWQSLVTNLGGNFMTGLVGQVVSYNCFMMEFTVLLREIHSLTNICKKHYYVYTRGHENNWIWWFGWVSQHSWQYSVLHACIVCMYCMYVCITSGWLLARVTHWINMLREYTNKDRTTCVS